MLVKRHSRSLSAKKKLLKGTHNIKRVLIESNSTKCLIETLSLLSEFYLQNELFQRLKIKKKIFQTILSIKKKSLKTFNSAKII